MTDFNPGCSSGSEPMLKGTAGSTFPDFITLAVIFLLYANVPAIAVRYYGLPTFAAGSIGLLLGIPSAFYLLHGEKPAGGRVAVWAVLFILTQVASLIVSDNRQLAWVTVEESIMEGLLVFLLIVNLVRTPAMLRRVTWTLLIVGSLLGFLSGWQYRFGSMRKNYGGFAQVGITPPLDASPEEREKTPERRASGPVGEVNRYGQIMLMLVPLGFFRFVGERAPILRISGLGAAALAMIGVALSFSRGAAISFVLLVCISTVLRFLTVRRSMLLLAPGIMLAILSSNYRDRLLSLNSLQSSIQSNDYGYKTDEEIDTSFEGRDTEMRAAFLMYIEHPALGVGPGLYAPNYIDYASRVGGRVRREEREPHSLYLNLLAETGTLGFLAYSGLLFAVFRELIRARRHCRTLDPDMSYMIAAFILSLAAYLLTGLFLHLKFVRYFWLMLGLATAAARIGNKNQHGNAQERMEIIYP